MNAQIAPGMNVLAGCESLTALDVFTADGPDRLVERLEEYVRALPLDMGTKKGQEEIRSVAAKIARTKTGLDDLGKDHVAHLKKQTGAIDAQRKFIRDRLDALRDEVRAPLTQFEEAEANRISEHERLLVLLAEAAAFSTMPSLADLDQRIAKVVPFQERAWEEFHERATEAIDAALNKLNGFREAAVKQEADAAEMIELRRQAAEYEAQKVAAAIEAEKAAAEAAREEREAARVAQAVETARLAAEAGARREAERAAQAVRDAEAAAARAVEEERQRVAAAAAKAEADRLKVERNKKHRAKVHTAVDQALLAVILGLEDSRAGNIAEQIRVAIANGEIPHVSITY